MADMADLDMGFVYDRHYENDMAKIVDVECNYCHWDEEISLALGECADGGIECQVCDVGTMYPVRRQDDEDDTKRPGGTFND